MIEGFPIIFARRPLARPSVPFWRRRGRVGDLARPELLNADLSVKTGHLVRTNATPRHLSLTCGTGTGGGLTSNCGNCSGNRGPGSALLSFAGVVVGTCTNINSYFIGSLGDYCVTMLGCCGNKSPTGMLWESACPPFDPVTFDVRVSVCLTFDNRWGTPGVYWEAQASVNTPGNTNQYTLFVGHAGPVTNCFATATIPNTTPAVGTLFGLPGESPWGRESMASGGTLTITPGGGCP